MRSPAKSLIYAGDDINWASPQARGLVGCWPLNEGGGRIARDLVGKNNGTLINGPSWTISPIGTALSFAGEAGAQYIPITPISLGTEHTTLALVCPKGQVNEAKFGGTNGNGSNSHCSLFISGNGTTDTIFGYTEGAGGASATIADLHNRWHFLATVRRNKNILLYADGILVGGGTLPLGLAFSPTYLGRRDNTRFYYKGYIANMRFYNRALSAAEVSDIYLRPHALYQRPRQIILPRGLSIPQTIASGGNWIQSIQSGGHNISQVHSGGHRIW